MEDRNTKKHQGCFCQPDLTGLLLKAGEGGQTSGMMEEDVEPNYIPKVIRYQPDLARRRFIRKYPKESRRDGTH